MKDYRVGIVGLGVVGKCVQRLFKDDVVAIYDPAIRASNKESFKYVDIAIISVPTNEKENWEADTTVVWQSLEWLSKALNKNAIILIKSTVPPTEIEKMHKKYKHVVFSPEFSGESKYYTPPWKYPDPQNMESHTWQVFGGDYEDTTMCVDIFKRRMGVDTQFWQTDIKTASLAKYIENSFFAMKVTFVNEWYDIAKRYNVDWNELRELWLLDPRINRNHTLVFPRDRGYGGKCFPKDTRAIIYDVAKKGFKPQLMLTMDKVNWEYRHACPKDRDTKSSD